MKYSQTIGIVTALALIGICFLPWEYIAVKNAMLTGMDTRAIDNGKQFGRPGLLSIILSVIAIVFYSIPKIWAKRTNIFICMLNMAWGISRYILLTTCDAGDCPEKKVGIFLMVAACFIMMLMSFLPKLAVKTNQ